MQYQYVRDEEDFNQTAIFIPASSEKEQKDNVVDLFNKDNRIGVNKFSKVRCFFIYLGACFLVFSFLILSSASGSSTPSPQVWNLSDANPVFVGREKQLQIINAFFIRGEGHVLALTGGSGFEKLKLQKNMLKSFLLTMTLFGGLMLSKIFPVNSKS